jgi:DNA recombination protein RmuC
VELYILIAVLILLVVNIFVTLLKNSDRQIGDIAIGLNKKVDESADKSVESVRKEFAVNRDEFAKNIQNLRVELNSLIKTFENAILTRITENITHQKNQFDIFSSRLDKLTDITEKRLEKVRETIENKLAEIQKDNSEKLEKMRETVDEKLHKTLEERLGESFKLVSDRLEKVQKGLGEMQELATGVGDLKKVLSNVKTKGVLGEYQLENILEQLFSPEQYDKNVKTKRGSNSYVEFAIKLPGKLDNNKTVWLPIDSKFPTEDYQVLQNAYENGNVDLIAKARSVFANTVKKFAKDIRDKYIAPPDTTDFAIMFLPVEGLYAEVLNNVGLFETLQREYKVVVTGPTVLAAFLNSLQMGFRTLAIEKRSSEVWDVLSAVKTEFGKFGEILDKTKKKLQEASNVIDKAGVRTRAIERQLNKVQELPVETKQ